MFTLRKKSPPSQNPPLYKEPQSGYKNRLERKEFCYYMQLFDDETQALVGHLADINTGGFKLDSQHSIPPDKNIRFRMNLTSEVADKPRMYFVARSRWCKVDPLDPFAYNVGFQLINISPEDDEIFNRMIEKYGKEKSENRKANLRRTNMW